MKNAKMLSLLVLPVAALLTACQIPNNQEKYIEKKVPVVGFNNERLPNDATCRFYNDCPTIPFIDINSYYKYFLNKEVEISTIKKGVYLIETFKGSATIDVNNDILYSDDYNQFINTTFYRNEDAYNVYYDGAPYLKVDKYNPSKEVNQKTIDFKKYKIDFKYDNNKLWAPLITYSDMFKGVTMIQSFYNGNAIYLVDSNNIYVNPCYLYSTYYQSVKNTFFEGNVRNAKVAELSYLEMCFVIDHYYGLPGRSPLDEMIGEYGLDYALSNYSDSTRLTKEFLLSTDISKYIAGMNFLGNLLNDGGHTVMQIGSAYLESSGVLPSSIIQQADHLYYTSGYEPIPPSRAYDYTSYYNARVKSTGNNAFVSKGDTFVYAFDEFDIDYRAWDSFYSGDTKELPSDSIGNFHRAIELAKQDSNIKNFVLDISINGGGFGDVVVYLMGAIANKPSMYYYDHIDERNIKQDYLCDLNLDGEFNELDACPIADFNFGILTSEISFSCANLLPALAKDNGIAILGGNTGGGACAVLDNCSMEGIYYRTSSFLHLNNSNFESIDKGVEVDYDLLRNNGLLINYNNLYNLNLISQKMNGFYGEE